MFEKASLKLVFMTDDLNAVAEALASLQKYSLEETYQVITNRIG